MASRPGPGVSAKPHTHIRRIAFEQRLRWLCFILSAPGLVVAGYMGWREHLSLLSTLTLIAVLVVFGLIVMGALLEQTVRPLQTLSNVIGALREEDFSFRARGQRSEDALGELASEINQFADILQQQRMSGLEATALLQRVVASMDAPVLAFDPQHRLRLMNPAASRLLAARIVNTNAVTADPASKDPIGCTAAELGIAPLLAQADGGIVSLTASSQNRVSRWLIHRNTFRQQGVPHILLVLSDVSLVLREEERAAFQRLVRVLGHEINNSLTPIKSIANSLRSLLITKAQQAPSASESDLERGLRIIESRAESLQRFVEAYRALAQLPPPTLQTVSIRPLLQRVCELETLLKVSLANGPDLELTADADQIEHLLINIVRNAAEAALAAQQENGSKARVEIKWQEREGVVEIAVNDNGLGISNASNLFVPFYTTKPGGTGVGLLLARQIAEAHGGTVELASRPDGGCQATVILPISVVADPTRM